MFILTIKGKEKDGAYSVINEEGDHIVYIFQEEDDAVRYSLMLEEDGYPELNILEVEEKIIIKTCQMHDYDYLIITPDDIVIPPNSYHDFV